MFAAEEAAIRDDGFSARVMDQAHGAALAGAARSSMAPGMAGFGAALAGIMEMSPLPAEMTGWWGGLSNAVQSGGCARSIQPACCWSLAALVAGVSFLALAVAAQER